MGRCKQKQRRLRGLLCRCTWPSITEWVCTSLLKGPRLRNDLYCVEWDVKLYYTIPNHGTCLQPNFTFICHPAAGPTVHQDRLFQACFPIFSTVCLEPAATNSSHQRLCVCFSNLVLKLFYLLRLSPNTDPTCRQRL